MGGYLRCIFDVSMSYLPHLAVWISGLFPYLLGVCTVFALNFSALVCSKHPQGDRLGVELREREREKHNDICIHVLINT